MFFLVPKKIVDSSCKGLIQIIAFSQFPESSSQVSVRDYKTSKLNPTKLPVFIEKGLKLSGNARSLQGEAFIGINDTLSEQGEAFISVTTTISE